jgi:hypothetical protein
MESMTVQVLLTELETARESLDRAFACLIPAPRITKPLYNELPTSGKSAYRSPTIKFVTENGFAIERVCERESSTTDSACGCHFVVRGPNDEERRVSVAFAETAIQLVQSSRGASSLPLNSSFWLRCAERHLATYLWEMNEVPPGGRLIVDQLLVEDQYLARLCD